MIIKIEDTLQSNQTYNIGFADCIKDFTEGNSIPFYNYAFSTGNTVDSFLLKGTVTDALTLQNVPNCYVFAYSQDIDSLPLTTRPKYISKTQKDGSFLIKNIKSGNYKIFALKDINSNLIFDLPNEEIAFVTECKPSIYVPKDTLQKDSANHKTDSITAKSDSNDIKLCLFMEEDTTQSFVKMQNTQAGKYEFIYKNKIFDADVSVISNDTLDYWQIVGNDTITWYMKKSITDSVSIVWTINNTVKDTLYLTPFKEKEGFRERRNQKEKKVGILAVTATNMGELFSPLTLHFSYPIQPVDSFDVKVIKHKRTSGNDTTIVKMSIPDTFVMSMTIPVENEEKVPYIINIADSVFHGWNNNVNDSVELKYTTKTEKDYGDLQMIYKVQNTDNQYIIQLLNDKDEIIRQNIIRNDTTIVYPKLAEGKYKIKVIEDQNENGKWDTGNYRKKILPEKIFFFSKEINVRGYWELEEIFEF